MAALPPTRFKNVAKSANFIARSTEIPQMEGRSSTEESQYLQAAIGQVLVAGITQILASHCSDPVDALGRFLVQHDKNKEESANLSLSKNFNKSSLDIISPPQSERVSLFHANIAEIFRPPTPPPPTSLKDTQAEITVMDHLEQTESVESKPEEQATFSLLPDFATAVVDDVVDGSGSSQQTIMEIEQVVKTTETMELALESDGLEKNEMI
ncbi:hypothetical protein HK100_011301 [Physocladia obscura]|uniref:Uncharacterized protein n=1 Tax=Physocladia obscura TaxID=109957 RepID=A0AAD5T7C8_9FUNG|nr:hypothetical protein HK100_011301 [Physocladia obscura]